MESQRVVVVVEEAAAARTALEWAVRNFLRSADLLTLLHVYPATKSRVKQRLLRLKGFQLALSFKDLCNGIAEAKVEIIVMEGDKGPAVVSFVSRIGASALIVGLHHQSFLYKRSDPNLGTKIRDCRILAIKQHTSSHDGLVSAEFSQIEITEIRGDQQNATGESMFSYLSFSDWKDVEEIEKELGDQNEEKLLRADTESISTSGSPSFSSKYSGAEYSPTVLA